jgi:hypothetical protein
VTPPAEPPRPTLTSPEPEQAGVPVRGDHLPPADDDRGKATTWLLAAASHGPFIYIQADSTSPAAVSTVVARALQLVPDTLAQLGLASGVDAVCVEIAASVKRAVGSASRCQMIVRMERRQRGGL